MRGLRDQGMETRGFKKGLERGRMSEKGGQGLHGARAEFVLLSFSIFKVESLCLLFTFCKHHNTTAAGRL